MSYLVMELYLNAAKRRDLPTVIVGYEQLWSRTPLN